MRREGKRIRTEHLEVRALASLLLHPRVGLIVPRYKHSAVDRNRLKRRLREIARTRLLPVLPPVDLVIRVLPAAYDAPFEALLEQIERQVERIARVARAAPAATDAPAQAITPPTAPAASPPPVPPVA